MSWLLYAALVVAFFLVGMAWERRRVRRDWANALRSLPVSGKVLAGQVVGLQEDGTVAVALGAREHPGSELPAGDVWPAGYDPAKHLGALRVVEVKNGHGGALVLKVRGGAFRVVSFTRPTKFDPMSGEADTTDLWLDIDSLVRVLKEPWS